MSNVLDDLTSVDGAQHPSWTWVLIGFGVFAFEAWRTRSRLLFVVPKSV